MDLDDGRHRDWDRVGSARRHVRGGFILDLYVLGHGQAFDSMTSLIGTDWVLRFGSRSCRFLERTAVCRKVTSQSPCSTDTNFRMDSRVGRVDLHY